MSAWTNDRLPALRRTRIDLLGNELAAFEGAEVRDDCLRFLPAHGCQGADAEGLTKDRSILEQRPIGGIEAIEARRDERVQRFGDVEADLVADGAIDAVDRLELAVVEQHPDRFDGIQRDPVGALQDGEDHRIGKARNEPIEQLRHVVAGQRLERQRDEVPTARAPGRAPLEQLRAGHRHDEDRATPTPLDQVVDEVEEARVRPLEILEHEDDGPLLATRARRMSATPRRARRGRRRCPRRRRADCRRRGSIQRRSPSSDTYSTRVSAMRVRVVAASSVSISPARLRTISPRAQKVIPSPYAGERPWCQSIDSLIPSMYLWNSQARRLLPMPGWPITDTSRRRRSRVAAWSTP